MSEQDVLDRDQTSTQPPAEQGMEKYFFRASAADFKKIPGSPIAYYISDAIHNVFNELPKLIDYHHACSGLQTGDNERHLRQWHEVNTTDILSNEHEIENRYNFRWYFHRKGGEFRKWYGNIDYILNWANDGAQIRQSKSARPQNLDRWFSTGVTWSHTSSGTFSARILRKIDTINVEGPSAFAANPEKLLGYLASKPAYYLMSILNPTMHFLVGSVSQLPLINDFGDANLTNQLVRIGRSDWDSYETSWDFTALPLLQSEHRQPTLTQTYQQLRAHWLENTLEMQRLEEENNRIFIDAYGLQDELTPDVPLKEITLTCNPHYRYGGEKTDAELEKLLQADTMREFISYAVGCMFGRYSLDKPGLVLANQGESLKDYLAQVPEPSFMPDEDNVIPLLNGDWFADDITERFRQFLRVTFGEEHYEANLAFVEASLGKDIRRYFVQDFYKDHVQTYKRRPIYWLFSSPKGSFNALIYMHRYTPDTVSIVLNDYLREFRTKLASRKAHLESVGISASASQREKTAALKEIADLNKIIAEIDDYERDILYPLATQKIEIDLDDGVKENYPKFGKALNNAPKL